MRAIRFDGHRPALDPRASEPAPAEGEAIVRPVRLGIGSSDRAIASGATGFTGIMGHEFVGIVETVRAEGVLAKLKGKRVVGDPNVVCGQCDRCRAGISSHCRARAVIGLLGRDGCYADRFSIPARNLVEVPDAVDNDRAVFAGLVAAALHLAQIVRVEDKPYVTVLGDGPMGLITAQVLVRHNASVRVLGHRPAKLALCEKWGIKHRPAQDAGRRQDQDIVVDCTGSPEGVSLALRLIRPRGKVLLKSRLGRASEAGSGLPPEDLDAICRDEVQLVGARCGRIADAIAFLSKGAIDVVSLISRRARLDDAATILQGAVDPDAVRVVLDP